MVEVIFGEPIFVMDVWEKRHAGSPRDGLLPGILMPLALFLSQTETRCHMEPGWLHGCGELRSTCAPLKEKYFWRRAVGVRK